MESKFNRIHNAITNIETASKYYLKENENKLISKKIPQNEYLRIQKSLKKVYAIVNSLRFDKVFENDTLNLIRRLNLSIKDLYEEGDYNLISFETMKTNGYLCHMDKEQDKKKLTELKQTYNSLTNFYKYRLSKAEAKPDNELKYNDKGTDNIKFIIEKYLLTKYNFKEIKYESMHITEENTIAIANCNQIIKDNKNDEYIKNIYSLIRNCIIKYANAEIIISVLNQIIGLCQEKEFINIKEKAIELITKYQKEYKDNKEEYEVLINVLNNKMEIPNSKKMK